MKKKLSLGCAGVFLLLLLVGLLGPRPRFDLRIREVRLGKDLDGYLKKRESRFGDLRVGVEKKIVWADRLKKQKTPWSVVYLHGFSATRREVAPVMDLVGKALGANVYYTRLQGHGRGPAGMSDATVNGWLNDGVEALEIGRRLGHRVLLTGTSTGASLGLWLVGQKKWRVDAMVLMSTNFYPKNKAVRILSWPWARTLVRLIVGKERSWKPANEEQGKAWTWRYRSDVLIEMMGLVNMLGGVDLGQIKQPTLMMYSRTDRVIDAKLLEEGYAKLGASQKKLIAMETKDQGRHVLAGDILSPGNNGLVVKHCVDFVRGLKWSKGR